MFVFLFILFPKIVFALPTVEDRSATDIGIDGTTNVPSNLAHDVEKSSNELQKAVNSLQTAIQFLFPKRDHQKKGLLIGRQAPLFRCLIWKGQLTEEEQKLCQEMYKKTSEDELSKEENTPDDSDDLSAESNEEMQQSALVNNVLNRKRTMLDTVSQSPLTQYWFNRSRSPKPNLDTINLNRKQSDHDGSMTQWLSNFHPIKDTVKNVLNMRNMAQSNGDGSSDRKLNLIRTLSRFIPQKSAGKQEDNSSSRLLGEHQNEFDINKASANLLNLGRTLDQSMQKNTLLDNLRKTLGTLGSIIDAKDFDSKNNNQASLKLSDIVSLVKSQKFSWKFLQFLNTMKNTLDQSIANNKPIH